MDWMTGENESERWRGRKEWGGFQTEWPTFNSLELTAEGEGETERTRAMYGEIQGRGGEIAWTKDEKQRTSYKHDQKLAVAESEGAKDDPQQGLASFFFCFFHLLISHFWHPSSCLIQFCFHSCYFAASFSSFTINQRFILQECSWLWCSPGLRHTNSYINKRHPVSLVLLVFSIFLQNLWLFTSCCLLLTPRALPPLQFFSAPHSLNLIPPHSNSLSSASPPPLAFFSVYLSTLKVTLIFFIVDYVI